MSTNSEKDAELIGAARMTAKAIDKGYALGRVDVDRINALADAMEAREELATILGSYLHHTNETVAQVKEILHQGRHAQVARRALRLIEDRAREIVVGPAASQNALVVPPQDQD